MATCRSRAVYSAARCKNHGPARVSRREKGPTRHSEEVAICKRGDKLAWLGAYVACWRMHSRLRQGGTLTHSAIAYSALTVLPAEVCADTSTDSFRSMHLIASRWNGSRMNGYSLAGFFGRLGVSPCEDGRRWGQKARLGQRLRAPPRTCCRCGAPRFATTHQFDVIEPVRNGHFVVAVFRAFRHLRGSFCDLVHRCR